MAHSALRTYGVQILPDIRQTDVDSEGVNFTFYVSIAYWATIENGLRGAQNKAMDTLQYYGYYEKEDLGEPQKKFLH